MNLQKLMEDDGLVAILRNVPDDKLLPVLEVLALNKIKFIEIALNTPNAYDQIKRATDNFGDKLIIGAGTTNTIERYEKSKKSGAKFFLSPGLNNDVLAECSRNNELIIPGFLTPTEAMTCIEYGYTFLKLFPAGNLDDGYLKAIQGPLDEISSMAVGGVNLNNIEHFFNLGFSTVGIGSGMTPRDLIEKEDWDGLGKIIRQFREKVDSKKVK